MRILAIESSCDESAAAVLDAGKGLLAHMSSFAVGRRGVTREDSEAWLAELEELGRDGDFFFSLNRYLFVADNPATI